ncbi:Complement factor H [Anabarilius grahami]|uniref:Complement factor H n=1 Tax=Anabarilius grahami TaxID=495550 RepID=A0A3N0Y3H6_ANAGA|nr:Complement factor H [Anabarilius grahami]
MNYVCYDGYGYKNGEATCTRDGWDPNPLCAVKMCAAPIIPYAEILGDQRPKYNIDSRIRYKCHRGFEPEQPVEITCNSRTEWTDIQPCTAKPKLCPDPSVENGMIHTLPSNEEEIFYTCNTGYKTFSGNWWDSVTCSRGSWSEKPRCIREEECGAFPSVHHGKLKQTKQIFNDGDATVLECDPGFKPTKRFIKCVSGTWETPVCEVDVHCDIPPKVENALITSKPKEFYGDGSSLTYVCRSSFLMKGKSTVFCRSGTWEEAPTCKEPTCSLNTAVEDFPDIKGPVKPGHKLTFSCRQGLKLKGQREITCQSNGEWSSPFPKCEEVMCVANLTVNMRSFGHTGPEVSVRPGDIITLSCVGSGVTLEGQSKITCFSNGEWNVPFPKCLGEPTCSLNTAVEDFPDIKGPVKPGHKLTFSCRQGLKLKGQREITCQSNGEWSSPFPKCEEVMCVANLTVNMRSFGHSGPEVSVRPGDIITLSCVGSGVTLEGKSKITCLSNGEWNVPFPKCLGGKCGPPPHVNSADTIEMTKQEYNSGERVEYRCFNKYTLVQRHPYSKYLTCELGEWSGNIKCLKPCSVSVEVMDERGIELRWRGREKIFSPHGDRIEFSCKRGKSSIGLIQTCNDGVMDLPLCE